MKLIIPKDYHFFPETSPSFYECIIFLDKITTNYGIKNYCNIPEYKITIFQQEIESDEIVCNKILKDLCYMFKLSLDYLLSDNLGPTFNITFEYIE